MIIQGFERTEWHDYAVPACLKDITDPAYLISALQVFLYLDGLEENERMAFGRLFSNTLAPEDKLEGRGDISRVDYPEFITNFKGVHAASGWWGYSDVWVMVIGDDQNKIDIIKDIAIPGSVIQGMDHAVPDSGSIWDSEEALPDEDAFRARAINPGEVEQNLESGRYVPLPDKNQVVRDVYQRMLTMNESIFDTDDPLPDEDEFEGEFCRSCGEDLEGMMDWVRCGFCQEKWCAQCEALDDCPKCEAWSCPECRDPMLTGKSGNRCPNCDTPMMESIWDSDNPLPDEDEFKSTFVCDHCDNECTEGYECSGLCIKEMCVNCANQLGWERSDSGNWYCRECIDRALVGNDPEVDYYNQIVADDLRLFDLDDDLRLESLWDTDDPLPDEDKFGSPMDNFITWLNNNAIPVVQVNGNITYIRLYDPQTGSKAIQNTTSEVINHNMFVNHWVDTSKAKVVTTNHGQHLEDAPVFIYCNLINHQNRRIETAVYGDGSWYHIDIAFDDIKVYSLRKTLANRTYDHVQGESHFEKQLNIVLENMWDTEEPMPEDDEFGDPQVWHKQAEDIATTLNSHGIYADCDEEHGVEFLMTPVGEYQPIDITDDIRNRDWYESESIRVRNAQKGLWLSIGIKLQGIPAEIRWSSAYKKWVPRLLQ